MSERTEDFKELVKEAEKRQAGSGEDAGVHPAPSLPSPFAAEARSVLGSLSEVRDSVVESRRAYLRPLIGPSLSQSEEEAMSERERDSRDATTQLSLKAARQLLANLRAAARLSAGPKASQTPPRTQTKAHQEAVLELLDGYLRTVTGLFSEQKALRAKALADTQRLARLGALVRASRRLHKGAAFPEPSDEPDSLLPDGVDLDRLRGRPLSDVSLDAHEAQASPKARRRRKERRKSQQEEEDGEGPRRRVPEPRRVAWEEGAEEPLVEETPALAQENQMLFRRVNETRRELDELTGKVVGIGQLQEVFSEKILQQASDIERIHQTAVHSTENVKSGNQQLREAMQNRAGMRVWILFFLIVLTFTLWFLHWYNP